MDLSFWIKEIKMLIEAINVKGLIIPLNKCDFKNDKVFYPSPNKKQKSATDYDVLTIPISNPSWYDAIIFNLDNNWSFIAEEIAYSLVARIISRDYLKIKTELYLKSQDIIEQMDYANKVLFCDLFMACSFFGFCPITLDKKLSKLDSDYDNENCTYKGYKTSMAEYIKHVYGQLFSDAIASFM